MRVRGVEISELVEKCFLQIISEHLTAKTVHLSLVIIPDRVVLVRLLRREGLARADAVCVDVVVELLQYIGHDRDRIYCKHDDGHCNEPNEYVAEKPVRASVAKIIPVDLIGLASLLHLWPFSHEVHLLNLLLSLLAAYSGTWQFAAEALAWTGVAVEVKSRFQIRLRPQNNECILESALIINLPVLQRIDAFLLLLEVLNCLLKLFVFVLFAVVLVKCLLELVLEIVFDFRGSKTADFEVLVSYDLLMRLVELYQPLCLFMLRLAEANVHHFIRLISLWRFAAHWRLFTTLWRLFAPRLLYNLSGLVDLHGQDIRHLALKQVPKVVPKLRLQQRLYVRLIALIHVFFKMQILLLAQQYLVIHRQITHH